MKTYTIRLSAAEARYCRDAAKEFHYDDPQRSSDDITDYYLGHGEHRIRRDFLVDLERWVGWLATDFEVERELAFRKEAEAVSRRLDFVLEMGAGVEVEEPVPAGRLF